MLVFSYSETVRVSSQSKITKLKNNENKLVFWEIWVNKLTLNISLFFHLYGNVTDVAVCNNAHSRMLNIH